MADRTERRTLNHLIETCKDGARGFELAADHVKSPDLETLFRDAAGRRQAFVDQLTPFAQRLGGDADAGGTAGGALHRGWMMVKDAMTQYDESSIVEEALRGETAAVNVYLEALRGMLPPTARDLIEAQYHEILHTRDRLQERRAVAS